MAAPDGDAVAFAARVIEAMPEAGAVRLSGRTILALDDEDIGLVGAFRAGGWEVEALVQGAPEDPGPWEVLRLVALGVDRIATGDPEGLLATLDGRHPPQGLRALSGPARFEPRAESPSAEPGPPHDPARPHRP